MFFVLNDLKYKYFGACSKAPNSNTDFFQNNINNTHCFLPDPQIGLKKWNLNSASLLRDTSLYRKMKPNNLPKPKNTGNREAHNNQSELNHSDELHGWVMRTVYNETF